VSGLFCCEKFVTVQHPLKTSEIMDGMLAFQTDLVGFQGAGKARSASDRHMKQPRSGCE
jgi:hypothetical protein